MEEEWRRSGEREVGTSFFSLTHNPSLFTPRPHNRSGRGPTPRLTVAGRPPPDRTPPVARPLAAAVLAALLGPVCAAPAAAGETELPLAALLSRRLAEVDDTPIVTLLAPHRGSWNRRTSRC